MEISLVKEYMLPVRIRVSSGDSIFTITLINEGKNEGLRKSITSIVVLKTIRVLKVIRDF